MNAPINPAGNRYLLGGYAPVSSEITATDLPVTGTIPPELDGRFLRNGPNPIIADGTRHHLFQGDAMIHGVRIAGGKAEWYRNRWVRQANVLKLLREPPRKALVFAGLDVPVNTHVVGHAGRTMALVEIGTQPYEIGPELETIGTYDFDGTLPGGFTAHPHWDPDTGAMHGICYVPGFPFVQHVVVSAEGTVVRAENVPTPHCPMIHDFAMTKDHVLIFDLQVGFDPQAAMQGAMIPYRWDEAYQPRIGLLPKDGPAEAIRWFDVPPLWIFHPMNAYEQEGKVLLYAVTHPRMCATYVGSVESNGAPRLDCLTFDLATGAVTVERIDDRPQEFPRINDVWTGKPFRYGYTASNADLADSFMAADEPRTADALANRVLKYDLVKGEIAERLYGEGALVGEPIFTPAAGAVEEDHGYILLTVFDPARGASDLEILDARDITAPPLATIHLPARLPIGFHGSWVPS